MRTDPNDTSRCVVCTRAGHCNRIRVRPYNLRPLYGHLPYRNRTVHKAAVGPTVRYGCCYGRMTSTYGRTVYYNNLLHTLNLHPLANDSDTILVIVWAYFRATFSHWWQVGCRWWRTRMGLMGDICYERKNLQQRKWLVSKN
jgi:hypothetical protein